MDDTEISFKRETQYVTQKDGTDTEFACDLCGGEMEARYDGPQKLVRGFDLLLDYPEVVVGNGYRERTVEHKTDEERICQYCSSTIKALIETLRDGENPLNETG